MPMLRENAPTHIVVHLQPRFDHHDICHLEHLSMPKTCQDEWDLEASSGDAAERRRCGGGATEVRRKCDGSAAEMRRSGGGAAEARRRRGGSATEMRRSGGGATEVRRKCDGGAAEARRRRGGTCDKPNVQQHVMITKRIQTKMMSCESMRLGKHAEPCNSCDVYTQFRQCTTNDKTIISNTLTCFTQELNSKFKWHRM